MSAQAQHQWDRIPILLRFAENSKVMETYGFSGTQSFVALEGQRLLPRKAPSKTVFLMMHPSSTLHLLPLPTALAAAGLHVICAGSRYAKNDTALIMEKVCFDLAQYVKWAREELGYEHVILLGWSGGGSLSLFYQGQAEDPSLTHTAAGDEYDLTSAKLARADGLILVAAHLGRAETLVDSLDPSMSDEQAPDRRDPQLDIYSATCPHQPPFSADFIGRFRAAQVARNRRITAWVENTLDFLKRKNDGEIERGFVVHRTWCDVRWIDPSVDPNERLPNHSVLGHPRAANSAPAGLARYSSLRAWLSQWSIDRTQARGVESAARVARTPVLQIENGADDGVPVTHHRILHDALRTSDKETLRIAGAGHYYMNQPEQLQQALDAITAWSARKGLLDR